LFVGLTEAQQDHVVAVLADLVGPAVAA